MVDDRPSLRLSAGAVYRRRPDGLDLFVRLTPKSSGDAIEGVRTAADGRVHLALRVRAAPEKGAANAALEALLADRLELPKRAVSVVAGSTSRLKTPGFNKSQCFKPCQGFPNSSTAHPHSFRQF